MSGPGATHRRRGPNQLPAGRHGLSRTYVRRNQRERLIAAVGEVVHRQGFTAMTIEDVIGEAGVSRRTFYDHFKSKDSIFLAAYEAFAAELMVEAEAALPEGGGVVARTEAVLSAVVGFFVERPSYASVCLVEVLAAGPAAFERRAETMHAFAVLLDRAADDVPDDRRPPPIVVEAVIGGLCEILYGRIQQGELDTLPRLLPDLVYVLVWPYVGSAAAERARASALARV